jgi:hypothetical protein
MAFWGLRFIEPWVDFELPELRDASEAIERDDDWIGGCLLLGDVEGSETEEDLAIVSEQFLVELRDPELTKLLLRFFSSYVQDK